MQRYHEVHGHRQVSSDATLPGWSRKPEVNRRNPPACASRQQSTTPRARAAGNEPNTFFKNVCRATRHKSNSTSLGIQPQIVRPRVRKWRPFALHCVRCGGLSTLHCRRGSPSHQRGVNVVSFHSVAMGRCLISSRDAWFRVCMCTLLKLGSR